MQHHRTSSNEESGDLLQVFEEATPHVAPRIGCFHVLAQEIHNDGDTKDKLLFNVHRCTKMYQRLLQGVAHIYSVPRFATLP